MKKRVIILLIMCAVLHLAAAVGAVRFAGAYETIFGVAFFAGFVALFVALLDLLFHRGHWDFRLPMLLFISGYVCFWSLFFCWFFTKAD